MLISLMRNGFWLLAGMQLDGSPKKNFQEDGLYRCIELISGVKLNNWLTALSVDFNNQYSGNLSH